MSDETPESKWRSEMEQAFDELAQRQDETDVSVTKVLDVVKRIERMVRKQMETQGIRIDG
jgi:hypothetical protein